MASVALVATIAADANNPNKNDLRFIQLSLPHTNWSAAFTPLGHAYGQREAPITVSRGSCITCRAGMP